MARQSPQFQHTFTGAGDVLFAVTSKFRSNLPSSIRGTIFAEGNFNGNTIDLLAEGLGSASELSIITALAADGAGQITESFARNYILRAGAVTSVDVAIYTDLELSLVTK